MKFKKALPAGLIFLAVTIFLGCANRNLKIDQPVSAARLKNMLESQSYVFVARFANPLGVTRRDLSTGYDITVSKDTIISDLPFFGRGYIAPISPADVDFHFTSVKFTHTVTPARNGWYISIKPKDQKYLQELFFRIFENSSASLTVTSLDRSALSYDGYITERKKNK